MPLGKCRVHRVGAKRWTPVRRCAARGGGPGGPSVRISIIDSAECSCRTILLIFRVFVRGVFLASRRESERGASERASERARRSSLDVSVRIARARVRAARRWWGDGKGGGLVRGGAFVGSRGATGSFRHRRPRRTDVYTRWADNVKRNGATLRTRVLLEHDHARVRSRESPVVKSVVRGTRAQFGSV